MTLDIRPALEAKAEELREQLRAIEVLLGMEDTSVSVRSARLREGHGVGEPKMRAITKYAQDKGEFLQKDLVKDLKENSGSASLALRALAAQGQIEQTGREGRSPRWKWVGGADKDETNGDGQRRATVVDVGDRVREGRIVK